MNIEINEQNGKGFAIANIEGEKAGMMAYNISNAEFILIDHTEVEENFKGKGVGKAILYKIVEMARDKGIKIFPLCPFASAMFKKYNDIQDVLKK